MRRVFLLVANCLVLFLVMSCPVAGQSATTFRFEDPKATSVELVGEFNNWKSAPMQRDDAGVWTCAVALPAGTYGYKFLVNGENWTFDPANPARKTVEGSENSAVTLAGGAGSSVEQPRPGEWIFSYADPAAQSVFVVGSFNDWNTGANPLSKNDAGVWTATVPMPPGEMTYKFIVDGQWKTDPANPRLVEDGEGGSNSAVTVEWLQQTNDTPATP